MDQTAPAASTQVDLEAQAEDTAASRRASSTSARTVGTGGGQSLARTWTEGSNAKEGAQVGDAQTGGVQTEDVKENHAGQPVLRKTNTAEEDEEDALLALPPPPSYDVVVHNLSVAVPPFRAYIPTPIPIPIPRAVTDAVRRWGESSAQDAPQGDASDGLIVRNVNAVVRRGEVMAIIGGSGSGKTTLLHAIAARLGNLPIAEGHVSITPSSGGAGQDGAHPKGGEGHFKGMSKVVGFVRQNDYLLPHLTGMSPFVLSLQLLLTENGDSSGDVNLRRKAPLACVCRRQDTPADCRADDSRTRPR